MNPQEYIRQEPYKLYINGEFVIPEGAQTFDIVNPVNNEPFAKAYKAGLKEAEDAVHAAREAYDNGPWGKMSAKDRSKLLLKAARILDRRKEEFAAAETMECGKLYGSALYYEAAQAVDAFEYAAGKARCLEGTSTPIDDSTLNIVQWEPVGVVAEILPWNGPFMMGCQKISVILAAGNTVIVKPSSWASLSVLLLAEVFDEAGFPKGVVNVLTGSGSLIGNALVQNPLVDMAAMTGGTDTGKSIITASAGTVKDIALELGGKSPNVVFDDVNVDEAVKWARFAFTLNSGQVCVSGTRLILHKNIYEEFLEKLKEECERFVPGNGFDPKTTLSTLVHKDHAKTVWDYIEKGKKAGARLICGGKPYEEEAIALANATRFGLAGGVFTKDGRRGMRMAKSIRGGQIYVNSYFSKAMVESPGTGWKESGLGVAGIHKYMISKTIFIDTAEGSVPM